MKVDEKIENEFIGIINYCIMAIIQIEYDNNEIEISVEFGSKKNEATVWTCDLTQKYIDINGKYRS